jgi:hypothetical protein
METLNPISAPRRDSAADQSGAPPNGSGSPGALYLPHVPPVLRRTVEADRLRKAKFFKRRPAPIIAPLPAVTVEAATPEPEPIILTNPVSLREKIDIIRKIVAREFGITETMLMTRSQKHPIAHPRQLAMYFTIHILKRSYSDAGLRFNRDHATAINAERKVIRRMMADPDYRETVAKLRADILAVFEPKVAA